MPHTTYTESTLAQGGWVGHDEGRALNTDASNAQTVSATESVPSRHGRQGTGGAAAAHLNIDASNAQTSRQYLPRAMYIPYGTYIIHDTYDNKYRICLFTLKSNRHLHYMQVGHARPRGDGSEALVASTARLPSAPLSRVPASLATLHETVCFAARKQTVSLIQVTN